MLFFREPLLQGIYCCRVVAVGRCCSTGGAKCGLRFLAVVTEFVGGSGLEAHYYAC